MQVWRGVKCEVSMSRKWKRGFLLDVDLGQRIALERYGIKQISTTSK